MKNHWIEIEPGLWECPLNGRRKKSNYQPFEQCKKEDTTTPKPREITEEEKAANKTKIIDAMRLDAVLQGDGEFLETCLQCKRLDWFGCTANGNCQTRWKCWRDIIISKTCNHFIKMEN